MRPFFIYILPVLIPVLVVIGVNEYSREAENKNPYRQLGIEAMNTNKADMRECTWQCYNNTAFCKQNHVAFIKPYFQYNDPLYFGMIRLLKSTGNYAGANIVFLVILWPLLMYWLLIRVVFAQVKIRQLKKESV